MIDRRSKSPKYCPKHPAKHLVLASLWLGFAGFASLEVFAPVFADEIAPQDSSALAPPMPSEAAPIPDPVSVPEDSSVSDAAPAPVLEPAPVPAQDFYSKTPVAPPPQSEPAPSYSAPSQPVQAQSDPYIDTQDYSTGATQPYTPPENVIVRERSSGCEATLSAAQKIASGLCSAPPARQLYAVPSRNDAPPAWASVPRSWDSNPSRWEPNQASAQSVQNTLQYSVAAPRNLSVKPVTGANPLKWILPKGERMIFPLAIPVDITSVFGWRVHPITGKWSFHSGTDLGAPMGTPVLAAYSGQVSLAEFMGGYGLSVLLDHSHGSHETRYAHLSEVFVKPGQWVQQGSVIGLVGSTGNSTGPHLHFEALESAQGSLVAIDPSLELQTTLTQFAAMLKTARLTAKVPPNPQPKKSILSLTPSQD
jgi:murein DD-endopeptidase MepM/ murein hydrolase activator NlpD